jgi:YD repeat-containing protein
MINKLTIAILFFTIGITAQTTTNYEYDNLYRLKKVIFPTGSFIQYNYDANGNRNQEVRVFNNLSVEDIENPNSVVVYPNPFYNILNIETKDNDLQSLNLIDFQGRVISTEKASGNSFQLHLETLPQAVYVLEIITDKGKQRIKVIKK